MPCSRASAVISRQHRRRQVAGEVGRLVGRRQIGGDVAAQVGEIEALVRARWSKRSRADGVGIAPVDEPAAQRRLHPAGGDVGLVGAHRRGVHAATRRRACARRPGRSARAPARAPPRRAALPYRLSSRNSVSVRLVSRKKTNTARGFMPEATRWFLKARYHHAGPVAGWKRNATISSWRRRDLAEVHRIDARAHHRVADEHPGRLAVAEVGDAAAG